MSDETAVKPDRKTREKEPLVVGTWQKDTFVQNPTQPEPPITELGAMTVWVKKTFGETGGKFQFIRKLAVTQVLGVQQRITSVLKSA